VLLAADVRSGLYRLVGNQPTTQQPTTSALPPELPRGLLEAIGECTADAEAPSIVAPSVAATERGPRVFLPAVEAEVFAAAGEGGPKSFGRGVVHEVRKGDGVRVVEVGGVKDRVLILDGMTAWGRGGVWGCPFRNPRLGRAVRGVATGILALVAWRGVFKSVMG
jgi:hypothetical protein